jgi:hypothetical protein
MIVSTGSLCRLPGTCRVAGNHSVGKLSFHSDMREGGQELSCALVQ